MTSWKHWNIGGKTICVASCVAVGSMFTDWVTLGFLSLSGGPALFILASIALGVGVLKYRRAFPPIPWIDEDIENTDHYAEWLMRITQYSGKLAWTS